MEDRLPHHTSNTMKGKSLSKEEPQEARSPAVQVQVELDIIEEAIEEVLISRWDLVQENLKFKVWYWAWSISRGGYCSSMWAERLAL